MQAHCSMQNCKRLGLLLLWLRAFFNFFCSLWKSGISPPVWRGWLQWCGGDALQWKVGNDLWFFIWYKCRESCVFPARILCTRIFIQYCQFGVSIIIPDTSHAHILMLFTTACLTERVTWSQYGCLMLFVRMTLRDYQSVVNLVSSWDLHRVDLVHPLWQCLVVRVHC